MYVEAILVGLLIGFIRNGRLANFNNARFKGWGLIVPAFIVYLMPYILLLLNVSFDNLEIFPFISMGFVVLLALLNLEKSGMKIFLIGTALNMIAMAVNGFLMPIDLAKMEALGYQSFVESIANGTVVNYIDSLDAQSWTVFIGKIIGLPEIYPLARVISVGDILISVGVAMVVQSEMLLHSMRVKGSMVRFSYRTKI